jgi:hypothetical protein
MVDAVSSPQVEMGSLAMAKGSAGPLGSIAGCLPVRITQELTQPFEPARCHLLLDTPQLSGRAVRRISTPGIVASQRVIQ